MPEYYDNYYEFNNANPGNEYEYDPNADYDEFDDTYAFLDGTCGSDEDNDDCAATIDERPVYMSEIWTQLRLKQGDNYYIVHISNRGRVKPDTTNFQQAIATKGTQLQGTPYMVTRVGTRDYYIHELVWRAFVGPIRIGQHVRHKAHYVQKRKQKLGSSC